jgi:amidase
MDELVERSAVELRAMLTARKVSATEVVEAHLGQIAAVNGRVNAIVTLDSEGALSAARQVDAQPQTKAAGHLGGLPIAIKDLVDVAGMRTTLGSPIYQDRVPSKDASHVSRLRDAGAIIVGKTNTSEFGAGSQTFNPVFGVTRNPYDLTRTAGGSSGGAAAAVAVCMVPFADGSDFGGSLRNPASFCNVVGFRPSPGVVPQFEASDLWDPLSVVGPIGRTVADVSLLLRALADPTLAGAFGSAQRGAPDAQGELDGLRIAWSRNLGDLPIEGSVLTALERNLEVLEGYGCVIEEDNPRLAGVDGTFEVLRALAFVRERLDDVTNQGAGEGHRDFECRGRIGARRRTHRSRSATAKRALPVVCNLPSAIRCSCLAGMLGPAV